MTMDFESELDSIIEASKKKKLEDNEWRHEVVSQIISFAQAFKDTVNNTIVPTLQEIQKQLAKRKINSNIIKNMDTTSSDDTMSVYIYFNSRQGEYDSHLHDRAYVCFSCNPNQPYKNITVSINTTTSNHTGSKRGSGSFDPDKITDEIIKEEVMMVLRQIL